MSAKIIIFEDNETREVWIETNFNAKVMYFLKGFTDDPDFMLELPHTGVWEFDGINDQEKSDIHEVWDIGQEFNDDPERVHKREKRQQIENEIEKTEKLLEHYKEEYKKI